MADVSLGSPDVPKLAPGLTGLVDFVTLHRRDHYPDDDRQVCGIVGLPVGASGRQRRRQVPMALLIGSALGWMVVQGASFLEYLGVVLVLGVVSAVGFHWLQVHRGAEGDTLRCVALTTTHVLIVAVDGRRSHRVLADLPAGAITTYGVGVSPGSPEEGTVSVVSLTGPSGLVAELELVGTSVEALEKVMADAGLARLGEGVSPG